MKSPFPFLSYPVVNQRKEAVALVTVWEIMEPSVLDMDAEPLVIASSTNIPYQMVRIIATPRSSLNLHDDFEFTGHHELWREG
jgi:hypothetical protein